MSEIQNNKMGIMPINKLLINMSLPMIISMLVQSLYNIVDSVFVAKISENALTAVSLAFPFQNLMVAVASGTGVGVNALLSRYLGAKDYENSNKCANVGLFLVFISALVFMIIGFFFSKTFFMFQTHNAEIIELGTMYMQICALFCFGMFGQIIFERLLLSTGKTVFSMISQLVGAIFNIIFDPILIFGLLGFPKMGIAGAAFATVLGQIIAMLVAWALNIRFNKYIKLSIKDTKPSREHILEIYKIAVPSILMMSIGSVMTFSLNKILITFTATATAVFGVYFKLQSFIFMPVFGLNNGMVPIIAYNYGAGNKDRVIKTVKYSIMYAVLIMVMGFIAFQTIPHVLLGFFNASEHMLEIGIVALRIISISFLFAGFCVICSSVFQALGNGVYSLIVSICRQILVLIPVAYLMSLTGNLNLVWLSFPISELMSVVTSIYFIKKIFREKFN